jgi:hypothetical protein
MNRNFETLQLPETMKPILMEKYKKIRARVQAGTKYTNPEKLMPLTVNFLFKFNNLPINEGKLVGISIITKKEFKAFKLQILYFMSQSRIRDRQEYVLHRILLVSKYFGLGMPFYYLSKKILNKLWTLLKNTKDDVIAGVVSSISLLCNNFSKVSVNALCTLLGIRMCIIQSQIKTKIFERFRVSCFVSLVKSSDLLRKI